MSLGVATLWGYFLGDDFQLIADVTGAMPGRGTLLGADGQFRPVVWLTLWLDHEVYGTSAVGYHVTNAMLFGTGAASVAVLAWCVARSPSRGAAPVELAGFAPGTVAALAGAVFVLLPSHSEPVAWISGRADLILVATVALSLAAWIERRTLLALALWAVALCSKETALVLPVLFVAFEAWAALGRGDRPRAAFVTGLRRSWPTFGLALVFVAGRVAIDREFVRASFGSGGSGGPVRWLGRSATVLVRTALPAVDGSVWSWLAAVVMAVLVVGVPARWASDSSFRRMARTRYGVSVLVLLGAAAVCCLAVGRYGTSVTTVSGERFAYLPSMFVAIAMALVIQMASAPRVGSPPSGTGARLGSGPAVFAAVVMVVVLLGSSGHGDAVWRRAGGVSRQLTGSVRQWSPAEHNILLNTPDTLDGAYVWRNSMWGALTFVNGWTDPSRSTEVAAFTMSSPGDRAVVRAGTCRRCVVLVLATRGATFADVGVAGSSFEAPGVQVRRVAPNAIEARLAPGVPASVLWYFSEGAVHRVVAAVR